jgi:NAD(P)-dependent dehydrogenase (short-subunit alcohol dehydrogenase family)
MEITIRRMVAAALDNHGRLDGLVNNAAIFGAFNRFEANSIEAFDEIIAINVRAAWLAMQHAKPAMLASGDGGSIVNMASMAARRANRGLSLYGMTKAAIANLTMNAATEYAKHNIRVNAILPGPIDTDMLGAVEEFIDERHSEVARAKIRQSIPLGRYGRPEEIAGAAAFLLSSDAGFMTGARMPVDGGQSLE